MPRRRQFRSRLHQVRVEKRETQESMSRKTGLSLSAYRRLENKEIWNPPIRNLVNCALVLGVPLERVCESEWIGWTEFVSGVDAPPLRRSQ